MKKQILLLTFFVAAILAGTSVMAQKSYQTVPNGNGFCVKPVPLSGCSVAIPELHPVQGETYTYSVADTPAGATIRWFVVNNADLTDATIGGRVDSIVGFNGILPVDASYIDATNTAGGYEITAANPSLYVLEVVDGATEYNSATSTNVDIQISWKYFDGVSKEVLLVAYVEDATGCTNNIAVWRIIPEPAFTIDVALIDIEGDSLNNARSTTSGDCVSPIESAIYNSAVGTVPAGETPGDSLIVDYGENWVFFVVNGANYFDSWMPEFQLTYTDGDAPVAEMSWAYISDATSSDAANWNTVTTTGTFGSTASTWTSTVAVIAGANAASVLAGTSAVGNGAVPVRNGECIIVRVRLDWGTQIEHDQAPGILRFAANGIAFDGDDSAGTGGGSFFNDRANFEDLNNGGPNGTACEPDLFQNDYIDFNITARPQIEAGSPTQEVKTGQGVN